LKTLGTKIVQNISPSACFFLQWSVSSGTGKDKIVPARLEVAVVISSRFLISQSKVAQAVTHLTSIHELMASNLARDTDYRY
jgi:hypothetical protein